MRVVRRQIRRIRQNAIESFAPICGQGGKPIASQQPRAQPQSPQILSRQRKRLVRNVGCGHFDIRRRAQNRRANRAAARAQFQRPRARSIAQKIERGFDQNFGFDSRHERRRSRAQRKPEKLAAAGDVSDRLAVAPPPRKVGEARARFFVDRIFAPNGGGIDSGGGAKSARASIAALCASAPDAAAICRAASRSNARLTPEKPISRLATPPPRPRKNRPNRLPKRAPIYTA